MTARQIEAARIAMTRYIKRQGKVWIRVFPDKPISKPAETRMGKGKSGPDHWVAIIKPGRILYEIQGVDEEIAREAFVLQDITSIQDKNLSNVVRCCNENV